MGSTTDGKTIVFDGFSGATVASGATGPVDRTVEAAGVTFVANSPAPVPLDFQFIQDAQNFTSPITTLTFDNQGGTAGSLVVRQLDLQFSTVDPVPEPSSTLLLGLAGGMLAFRRRK